MGGLASVFREDLGAGFLCLKNEKNSSSQVSRWRKTPRREFAHSIQAEHYRWKTGRVRSNPPFLDPFAHLKRRN
jgi:hypothetical protein